MDVRRTLAAGAGICSAVAIGIALVSEDPARAIGPPPDGTYTLNEAGVSGVTWTIGALCDQPSGTRNMNDYNDPIVFAMNCALNVVSATPEQIALKDQQQNFTGRARMTSMLWTFTVNKSNGVVCPDGSTAPSSDTYAFSDETMTGTHTIVRGAVCGMQPSMTKQPFSLQQTGPPPSPIQRYPLYCNAIAMCY
ncbi:hypothetical protein [Mycobacterium sp. 852002-51057_SCH5723018]|uniref:hypothetical protein n=1 Tax=Mycobacterium sp. 852002-51057_SCH5723018 TaxID=1834094 RepID=UPI000802209E|nr:hypothetical protein [Mycobacterium sp. 852002-51057_SCH5723018]OBG30143.1 hypothetical protein A5764_19430 [Mycobacterium sp. 852002-51057_SCH5723018]